MSTKERATQGGTVGHDVELDVLGNLPASPMVFRVRVAAVRHFIVIGRCCGGGRQSDRGEVLSKRLPVHFSDQRADGQGIEIEELVIFYVVMSI
jgi:hypothetical protein